MFFSSCLKLCTAQPFVPEATLANALIKQIPLLNKTQTIGNYSIVVDQDQATITTTVSKLDDPNIFLKIKVRMPVEQHGFNMAVYSKAPTCEDNEIIERNMEMKELKSFVAFIKETQRQDAQNSDKPAQLRKKTIKNSWI